MTFYSNPITKRLRDSTIILWALLIYVIYTLHKNVLKQIEATQTDAIAQASEMCAETIAADGLVYLFGSGHSRMAVEEIFPRYGSFPGFFPIVELAVTFHNQVVGCNGQRQALFLENISGYAEVILRNFTFGPHDCMIVFSNSGTNILPIEMAMGAKHARSPRDCGEFCCAQSVIYLETHLW